jgi:hypothetical protein
MAQISGDGELGEKRRWQYMRAKGYILKSELWTFKIK